MLDSTNLAKRSLLLLSRVSCATSDLQALTRCGSIVRRDIAAWQNTENALSSKLRRLVPVRCFHGSNGAWCKVSIFLRLHSVPSSFNDWTMKATQHAELRREEACAVCAVKDWLENRYRVYLFQESTNTTTWFQYFGFAADAETSGRSRRKEQFYVQQRIRR